MGASSDKIEKEKQKLKEIPSGNKDILKNYILIDQEKQKLYESFPGDQYLCPICGEIPELVNIHTDNGNVEFKCKIDGEILLNVDQYFKKLSESNFNYYRTKCCKCNNIQNKFKGEDQIFKYCYLCKENYCSNCIKKEEHPKNHLVQCIPVNALSTRCKEHYNEEYTSFCRDCNENICNENSSKMHKGHNKKNFFKIEPKKKIILEKNKLLSSIIKFNELILNTYEKHPDNYFHIINVATLAESIIAENSRNSRELEDALKNLEQKLKHRKSAIENFNKKFKTKFNGQEEILILRKKEMNDEDFKLLTKIGFSRLKHLDLGENKITDISDLKTINTSNLSYLSFNDNNIKSISVLESLDLSNLKELGLKNNKISDVSTLLKSDLPSIEFLRLEGNDEIDLSMNDFKKVIKKYTKKLIYVVQTFKDFNKKYDCEISKDDKEINLRDTKKGNDILKDLYLISSDYNNVTKLELADCEIEDISLLSRMSFNKLKTLDLSMNKIKNIEIFNQFRFEKLTTIYLNDNQISNITPLRTFKKKFPNLNLISIKDNNIVPNTQDVKNIVKYCKEQNITLDIDD